MRELAEILLWVLLVIELGWIGVKVALARQAKDERWWWSATMMVTTEDGDVAYRTALGGNRTRYRAEVDMHRAILEVEKANVEVYLVNTAVHRAENDG